jgi:hypothetical protein
MSRKTANTEAPKTETPMVRRMKDGYFVPDGFVMEYVDSKTGPVRHTIGEIKDPRGVAGLLRYGDRQRHQDCHSQIYKGAEYGPKGAKKKYTEPEVKPAAKKKQAEAWAAVCDGTWTSVGGGPRKDPRLLEALAILRIKTGYGEAKFKKTFGDDAAAVDRWALDVVRAAFAAKGKTFKATNEKHAQVVADKAKQIWSDADKRIADARGEKDLPEVVLPDDI